MIQSKEKDQFFAQPREDVVGSPADKNTYIYRLCDDDLMIREAEFTSKKGGEPVQIAVLTDTHLNRLNEKDWAERNPVVMSTRQFRMAFRNESTLSNMQNALKVAPFVDQLVWTGDNIDYLTWGSLDMMDEYVWEPYPDAMVVVGGHDTTRRMQGKVDDPTSFASRMEILQSRWKHDINYEKRILGDKVMLLGIYNNGEYTKETVAKLTEDIKYARENDLIILVFQHEPICSKNPEEVDLEPMRMNDPPNMKNFCDHFVGNDESNAETKAAYELLVTNADVVKGVICGHWHNDFYSEILATYTENGKEVKTVIPQYVQTGTMYDEGHVMILTVN